MPLVLRVENEASLPTGAATMMRVADGRSLDIGRGAHLDWTLPDPSRFISGKHCEIRYRSGGFWLYDVSTNGTFLNDNSRRLQAPHRLADGDRLTIGSYVIVVALESEAGFAEPERADTGAAEVHGVPAEPVEAPEPADAFAAAHPVEAPLARAEPLDTRAAEPVASFVPVEQRTQPEPEPEAPAAPVDAPMPAPAHLPDMPMPAPAAITDAPMPAPVFEENAAPAAAVELAAVAAPHAEPESAPTGPAATTADEFLARFAKGAGIPESVFFRQDALKVAEDMGALLRLIAENMTQLLAARFKAKRFARTANQTMIQALDNNPLKFAPTPEDALRIMLGPRTTGYLDARRALDAAFKDLKTHQLKTFSAMQGAVNMLVEDLDPGEIDTALGDTKSMLDVLGGRKARLWDLYKARWQAKTLRHEDGLTDAFMLYFAECYDRSDEQA